MVLLGFRAVAHEDVGGDGAVGHDAPDGSHTVHVPLAGIFAVHELQNAVGTALHGQMDVLADVGHVGNDLQRLIAHVFGMAGSKPHAHVGNSLGHQAQQSGESHFCGSREGSIRVDVLSQQGYFFKTPFAQIVHLAQDALHVARALTSTGVGHDAVVAEVVAATHDAHETANFLSVQPLGHNVAVGLAGRKFNVDGLMACFGLGDKVGQREIAVGAGHEVGMVAVEQVVLHALCHAAQHTDDERLLFFRMALRASRRR